MSTDCMVCPTHRDRRLKLAIGASISSKVATAALQLLVMPLAVRALGPERFGVFVMISSSLIWISSASIGFGNGLTIAISKAVAVNDTLAQSQAISSAFFTVLGICTLILSGMGIVHDRFGLDCILGHQYSNYQADIVTGLWLIIGFMIASLVLDVLEGTQAGHQETHIINLAGMLGQALSAVSLLVVVVWHVQSIINLILCLFVLSVIPRLVNSFIFVTISQPHLIPNPLRFKRSVLGSLLGTGIAFSLMGLGQFLRQQCSILLVGHMLGPVAVSVYAIIVNITMLAFGMIMMQVRPLLPAITDAWARGDREWIDRMCAGSCDSICITRSWSVLVWQHSVVLSLGFGMDRKLRPVRCYKLPWGLLLFYKCGRRIIIQCCLVWVISGLQ